MGSKPRRPNAAADAAGRTQQARTPPGDDVWDIPANHGEGAPDALGPRGIDQRCGGRKVLKVDVVRLHGSDAFEIQADLVQGQYGRRGAALGNRTQTYALREPLPVLTLALTRNFGCMVGISRRPQAR